MVVWLNCEEDQCRTCVKSSREFLAGLHVEDECREQLRQRVEIRKLG